MNTVQSAGSKPTPIILVVDEDAAMRRLLILHLQFTLPLAEYLEAADGQTALELAANRRPNLILLDGHLPIASGAEVARRLRRDPQLRHIPLIALTAMPRFNPLIHQLHIYCDKVFTKPGQLKTLRSTVQAMLLPTPVPVTPPQPGSGYGLQY